VLVRHWKNANKEGRGIAEGSTEDSNSSVEQPMPTSDAVGIH
jgi:hypothetical protein